MTPVQTEWDTMTEKQKAISKGLKQSANCYLGCVTVFWIVTIIVILVTK